MHRAVLASLTLLGLASLNVLGTDPTPANARTAVKGIALPGVQPGGAILLPNQWSLRPAGKQIPLGDFPVNLALHPAGQWLAVLHAGYGTHEVLIVNLKRQKVASRVTLDQTFYGLCFSPDGKILFASGAEFEVVHAYEFEDGLLSRHRELRVAPVMQKFIPGGLAFDPTRRLVIAAGTWGGGVCLVPLDNPEKRTTIGLGKDSFPYACAVDAAARRLYVSLWNKAALAVIDLEADKVLGTWPTEKHPTEIVLAPGGKALFVACANSTKVSVLDVTGKTLETISCALYPNGLSGNTPNSLCLTPDGQVLCVANADANNLAVFNVSTPGQAKPLGFIPAGWYPTSVRYNAADKRLYVANGKGTTPLANPQGPNPNLRSNKTVREYIAGLFRGTLSVIDFPTPNQLQKLTQ